MLRPVLLVVNLLELAQDDGRGDDAVAVLVVLVVVEAAQGRDAFQRVLDGRVRVQVWQQLPVVLDAVLGLVLGETAEMAGRDGKDGVEEMRLRAGTDGDDELKVSILVAQINLYGLSISGNGLEGIGGAHPVANLFNVVPHETCFLDVLEGETAVVYTPMLPRLGSVGSMWRQIPVVVKMALPGDIPGCRGVRRRDNGGIPGHGGC